MTVAAAPVDPWGILAEVRAMRAEFAERLARLDGAASQPDPDEPLTVETAARVRGCSAAAIYKLVSRGQLKATRKGRSVRVRRGDL